MPSLSSLITSYRSKEERKHQLKSLSDSIRSGSKHAITLLCQDSFVEAQKKLNVVEKTIQEARKLISKDPSLADEGFYRDALEEYAECKAFESFLNHKPLSIPQSIEIGVEELIGGICDATGELVRKTLQMADTKHIKEIQRFIKITQQVTDELSKVSFTGKLREKYDDLERNLSKLERVAYELRMKS